MTFRDADNDEVLPEYMAGYVAYGNGITDNPFPVVEIDEKDWSSVALHLRTVRARYERWKRGNRDAQRDSERSFW